ncbi:hypothetical protein F5Y18DRAFT_77524 [Xylariaceae sp. FL1019]|nr:hypothetical protein F5Y18DRAFT_77524 [Xylariaceae sp. FL1019]
MSYDNGLDVQELPACYRCHASKVRCRRAPGQLRCARCTRAAYPDCHPRPSRRGRTGQRQSMPRPSSTGMSAPQKQIQEDGNAGPSPHALMDLSGMMGPGEEGLSDMVLSLLDCDPGSLYMPLAPSLSQPSTAGDTMSLSFSETPSDCVTIASSASPIRDNGRDAGTGGREGRDCRLSRLSSASYMQSLTDLNAQMLAQHDGMLDGIRQLLAAPTNHTYGHSPTTSGDRSRATSVSGDSAYGPISEGPIEAALRLGLALRSLLRPHQTCKRDMPTALFLLSSVLRLASLLHDLLARMQDLLAQVTNKNALCAFVFPRVRLGSLLLDDLDDDRLRPLQMHSIAMALSTVEGLIDEVIQLTERSLPDYIHDTFGPGDDEDGNIKDDFGLQALARALVAKQEAVVETISGLRQTLGC